MIFKDLLNTGEVVVYKRGSRGEVVGVYPSIKSLADEEKRFNPRFKPASIYSVLHGTSKSYFSLAHQCKAVPRIRQTK